MRWSCDCHVIVMWSVSQFTHCYAYWGVDGSNVASNEARGGLRLLNMRGGVEKVWHYHIIQQTAVPQWTSTTSHGDMVTGHGQWELQRVATTCNRAGRAGQQVVLVQCSWHGVTEHKSLQTANILLQLYCTTHVPHAPTQWHSRVGELQQKLPQQWL